MIDIKTIFPTIGNEANRTNALNLLTNHKATFVRHLTIEGAMLSLQNQM